MKRHEKTAIINREDFENGLSKPVFVDEIILRNNKAELLCATQLAWDMFQNESRIAASFLCRAAKKRIVAERIEQLLQEGGAASIKAGLECSDAKMRKNTAKLISCVPHALPDVLVLLENALCCETVKMVIPSYILAIGSVGGETAHRILSEYKVPSAACETENKHINEINNALFKALSSFESDKKHIFTGFSGLYDVQLTCAVGAANYVAADCKSFGIEVVGVSGAAVNVRATDLNTLFKVRSFREILIPVKRTTEKNINIKNRILSILDKTHERNDTPYRFRVEYRGSGQRRSEIEHIVKAVECERLKNSVSNYEAELRVYDNGSVKLKLYTFPDTRFLYRKQSISASIHPANAALVMSFAKEWFCENAVVLDMCCGSGTMLFERNKARACKRLIGVDITEKAIFAAKENAKSACPTALFYHADCRKFTLREQVDEVISNLPFGSRVGTHENNEMLYARIFANMKSWLKESGVAIIYTMESKLAKREAEKNGFVLLSQLKTEAGGLFPYALVFKRL